MAGKKFSMFMVASLSAVSLAACGGADNVASPGEGAFPPDGGGTAPPGNGGGTLPPGTSTSMFSSLGELWFHPHPM